MLPLRTGRTELAAAAAVLGAWALLEHAAPILLHIDRAVDKPWGALALVCLLGALALAFARRIWLPVLPLVAFFTARFDEHTKWALGLAAFVLLAVLTPYLLESRGGRSLPDVPPT